MKVIIAYLIISSIINALLLAILFARTTSTDEWATKNFNIILHQLKIIYDEINMIKRSVNK